MRLTKHCDSAKYFWSYIKRVTGRNKISTVPDLTVLEDGTQVAITSYAEKARLLNPHFAKQTSVENIPLSFPELPPPSELSPESFSTTPADVYDTLSALKPERLMDWMSFLRGCCLCVQEVFPSAYVPCTT